MNGDTFRRALVPILFISVITAIAIYCITNAYKNDRRKAARQAQEEQVSEQVKDSDELVDMNSLEYSIAGVLIVKDEEKKSVTISPIDGGKNFLLEYDGTTSIYGKHGNALSMDQIPLGEIVNVTYSVHNGKLKTIQVSENAFTMSGISKFEINEKRKSLTIGDDTYKLSGDVVVSYGDNLAELMDVTDLDTIAVKGVDRTVYSIVVESGHGYLRLKNDEYFVGGWLEIGQDIIKPISSEMLVPVPEGKYHVKVTNKGYAGEKDMIIERDKEATLDLDEVEIQEVEIGHVAFKINPDYAQLLIDGEITEYTERVPLEYGIHKVHVELAGYQSVDTNIKILNEYADVEISLEKESSSSSSSSSSTSTASYTDTSSSNYVGDTSSSSSSSTDTVVISENRQMYVESPEGAEVYLDGNYIGIAPAHTNKVTGQHVITLSKTGYVTKSYTINVDNDDRDVTFSFSDLIADSQ